MIHSKLTILGALIVVAGFAAADAMSALRELPETYGSNTASVVTSNVPQGSTTSFVSSFTSSGSTEGSSTSDTTMNWAGYVSKGGTYTAISGAWTVPTVRVGSDSTAADATWIGIGGETSSDLIQVGTENTVKNGQVATSTFYEELPNGAVTIPAVNVSAGDTVTASIKEVASGEWSIALNDLTNGESYTNAVAYNSSESSAEWVEEAPSNGSSVIPLDEFGTITFTNGTATESGNTVSISGSDAQPLTMDNDEGQALTATSAVSSTGTGFTVTKTSASSDDGAGYGQYTTIPTNWTRHEPGMGGYYTGWGRSYREYPQSYIPSSVYMSW